MKRVTFTCTVEAEIEVDDAATVQDGDEFDHDIDFEKATDGNGSSGMEIKDYARDIRVLSVVQYNDAGEEVAR